MKVAVLTFHAAKNYGAVLQTHATVETLRCLGAEPLVIDYRSPDFSLSGNWRNPLSYVYNYIFERFIRQYMPLSRRYSSPQEIIADPPAADLYLFGSDQIWNFALTKTHREIFLGSFVAENKSAVTYAASFGAATADDMMVLQRYLPRMKYISVREVSGVELCRQAGADARVVLDPTLVLPPACPSPLNQKYPKKAWCSCFFLHDPGDAAYRIADQVSADLHLPVRLLNKNRQKGSYRIVRFPTPQRMVELIGESAFLITNSFHGVALAIRLETEFVFIAPANAKNDRISSLLGQLDLEDRFFESYTAALEAKPWLKPIDFAHVKERLKPLREDSLEFLKKCLKAI